MQIEIESAYVSTWDLKGGCWAERVVEHLTRANEACMERRAPDRFVIGVFPSMVEALRYNAEIKRMRKARGQGTGSRGQETAGTTHSGDGQP